KTADRSSEHFRFCCNQGSDTMQIENSTALIAAANHGIDHAFVQDLLQCSARKVYAAARHPESIDVPDATELPLDVTDPKQVADAAQTASDTNLLINNAGVTTFSRAETEASDDI